MSGCIHTIAFSTMYYDGINGYLVHESDDSGIRELLNGTCAYSSERDFRRRFDFCPRCGARLDWEAIETKNRLREL